MEPDNLKKTTISSLFWKLFERGGNAAVQLIIQVIMARLLEPSQFGELSIMLVFVNIGNVIVQSGLNTALIQSRDISQKDCSTVFWMSFVISVVLYGVVYSAAPAVADFYSMPNLVQPLRILALILPINSFNAVQIALITRELEMKKIFKATISSSLISAIVGIGLALLGAGVWALVFQQLSYQIVNCIAHALQLRWRPRVEFSRVSAGRLFKFGSHLLLSGLLEQGYQSLSDLIIGRQFSSVQLGLVSQGKRYPQAIGSVLDGAIQPVMLSAVSRVQTDVPRVKRLVRRALKTSTFLIAPSMGLFASVAPTLVPLLLGPQWAASVPYLQMYCIIYAFLPIHTTNLQALNGMGRSDLFLRLELVKKAYGIAAVLYFGFIVQNPFLLVGSYIVTDFVSTVVNAWPNRKVIRYSYMEQVRDIAPAFVLSIGSAVFVQFVGSVLPFSEVLGLLIQIIIYIVLYLGLAALLHLEELLYLVSTFKSILASQR